MIQKLDFFLVSRKDGASARVKTKTSSPVTVLISWCRLTTLMPVTSRTIASSRGAPSRADGSALASAGLYPSRPGAS